MTIGNQLKKARQQKEVTLEEVYQRTRIHPNVLAALEEDNFDKILNPTYIQSFLKEYATYLGLNPKKLLDASVSNNETLCPSTPLEPSQE